MKFTNEQKDILIRMIENELEYYERKKDIYEEDEEYIEELEKILKKLKGGERYA